MPCSFLNNTVRQANLFLFKLIVWPKEIAKAISEASDRFPTPFARENVGKHPVLDPLDIRGQLADKPYEYDPPKLDVAT